MRHYNLNVAGLIFPIVFAGCGNSTGESANNVGGATVGVTGGAASTGGAPNTGGRSESAEIGGASTAVGGASTHVATSATGGSSHATGGRSAAGGASATGGSKATLTGGAPSTGGAASAGGTSSAFGGRSSAITSAATGGSSPAGGTVATGGVKPVGGSAAVGGSSSSVNPAGGSSAATGGTVATGGTSSSSSAAGFSPCPSSGACKILPLGDSITYGMASSDNGGYRSPLFKKAVAANQSMTFTGSVTNGPANVTVNGKSVKFPAANEGHSGWTIDQIAGLVPSPAMSTIPNIVLMMAGTNDVYASSGQATMHERLSTLIDKVVAAAPDALLVVATLTPLSNSGWNDTAKSYDSKIPAVVQSKVDKGKHVVLVDMSKMATANLADGVHPNDTGYAYMADVWYAAIKDLLPVSN